ncbi:MAG: ABC-F family ATP-binding cassette domain-containing protein, partial [Chloroflexi bacterium]|nr:ABC-F family ATP-binding cassette domain-containing protein [Chloroflexota bacterium]
SILTAQNLSKEFGPEEIFSGVTVEIPHKARIALVGPNGAGKPPLLNLLIGLDVPNEGAVHRSRNLRIGFLPQRPELHGAHTLWEEQLSAFADLRAQEAKLNALEQDLTDPDKHDAALAEYGELQERFELAGGYTYEQRIRTVLQGLGFKPEDDHTPLSQLSGGQKTRALLARLLLEAPDLLALDEPTNHLDIQAVEWLEGYLGEFPGAVLVVSHDRYFMDAVAAVIWELDFGTLETYRGNYSHYVEQREERHARLLKEFEAQQEFIAKEEEYIRRNMAGQNTRQAQGRLKRLNRLKRDKLTAKPRRRQSMHLRMGANLRSGDKVLMTQDLSVGYADAPAPLFEAPDITLWRGEVAALIGPNGAGKSTFVKTAIGALTPLAGDVKLGASVKVGYFAQAHESLNPKNSIIDEITAAHPMQISEARDYLAQFLFQGDDVFRNIETLSGGERGRVALAKLALTGANLLLLDEPTNHLDIASQEILQNVLADFKGTILIVSHDRYLIDALATQIWAVQPGNLTVFEGPYKEYLAARDQARAAQAEAEQAANAPAEAQTNGSNGAQAARKHSLTPYKLQKRIAELEAQIETHEAALESITAELGTASASGDAARVRELGEAYTAAENDLHAAMAEWEALVDEH